MPDNPDPVLLAAAAARANAVVLASAFWVCALLPDAVPLSFAPVTRLPDGPPVLRPELDPTLEPLFPPGLDFEPEAPVTGMVF
ncbi:MAG: hypothetical protein ACRDHG_09265 [Anaerolineales bacterium]